MRYGSEFRSHYGKLHCHTFPFMDFLFSLLIRQKWEGERRLGDSSGDMEGFDGFLGKELLNLLFFKRMTMTNGTLRSLKC